MLYIFRTQNDFKLFPQHQLPIGFLIFDKPRYTFTEDTIKKDRFSVFFDALSKCAELSYKQRRDFMPLKDRSFEKLFRYSSSVRVHIDSQYENLFVAELTFSEEYKGLIKKEGSGKSLDVKELGKFEVCECIIKILNNNFSLLNSI